MNVTAEHYHIIFECHSIENIPYNHTTIFYTK